MKTKELGGFPSDLGEAEYEVELILEHAEGLNRLPYKAPEEAKEWGPWIRMIRWLEPQIEQYGLLPEAQDDVNFFTPGWEQDLASLYMLLINHSYGATWETGDRQGWLNAENELLAAILKINTSLEYIERDERAKKELEKRAEQKAHMNSIRPKTRFNEALQEVIDGLVNESDSFADLKETIRSITRKTEGPFDCDDYYYHQNEDGKETLRWTDSSGYEGNCQKLSALRPYYKRAKDKFNKKI